MNVDSQELAYSSNYSKNLRCFFRSLVSPKSKVGQIGPGY